MEPKLKEHISKRVSRGKITLSINYTDFGTGLDKLIINETMADELNRQLLKLKKKYKLSGEPEIKHFLQFPDIFRIEKAEDIFKEVGSKAQAYNNLGCVYFAEGDYEMAVKSFEEALRVSPEPYGRARDNLEKCRKTMN